MCGTDYNRNIPKIGPEKAYRLLQKYESLENIEICCKHLDISILNYKRVRELFCFAVPSYHAELWQRLPSCGFPDMTQLSQFCFEWNCKFDINRLYRAFFISSRIEYPPEWLTESKEREESASKYIVVGPPPPPSDMTEEESDILHPPHVLST
jgi:hypothetical protein